MALVGSRECCGFGMSKGVHCLGVCVNLFVPCRIGLLEVGSVGWCAGADAAASSPDQGMA